jgi:hypothetical protein
LWQSSACKHDSSAFAEVVAAAGPVAAAAAAAQVAHQQELARYGHSQTTAELQAMVGALQKEVDTHAGHARKAAVSWVARTLLLLLLLLWEQRNE